MTIIIAVSTALCAIAKDKDKMYFNELSSSPNVSYTYLSPDMLATMGDRTIEFSLTASQLNSMETVKIYDSDKLAKEALKTVKKLIKKEKLKTLATSTKSGNVYTTVMGRQGKDKKTVTQLLHIHAVGDRLTTITYITGDITLNFSSFN